MSLEAIEKVTQVEVQNRERRAAAEAEAKAEQDALTAELEGHIDDALNVNTEIVPPMETDGGTTVDENA